MHQSINISQSYVVEVVHRLDALDEPVGRRAQLHGQQRRVRQTNEAREGAAC